MRNRAIVEITDALFLQAFPFPDGTELIHASVNERGNLCVVVQHGDLPDVPDGQRLPTIEPLFRRATFVDWGISQ